MAGTEEGTKDRHKSLGKEERERMPVKDVWLTPATLSTPRWWKISSTIVIVLVSTASKILLGLLNKTSVEKLENLYDAIDNRPKNKPLITASNHLSCFDDPLLACMLRWKHIIYREETRWLPGAKSVCFKTYRASLFFQLGKVLPIVRGDGVYQHTMNFLVDELTKGKWVHIYPEGKVNMTKEFIRLKWGIGRLIADSKVCPVVLPYWHIGMDNVLPNKKPYIPQIGQKITVTIGEPMNFESDLFKMRKEAKSDVEIRKFITDKIQEEFKKLKAITEMRHFGYVVDGSEHHNNLDNSSSKQLCSNRPVNG